MNLIDSSFLCLDIGTHTVRGMGLRIISGKIARSAVHSFESNDTAFAIRHVVDAIESSIGARFDSAYVTGDFGDPEFLIASRAKNWNSEHKISESDVGAMISEIPELTAGYVPMHIVPLRYDLPEFQNVRTPIDQTGTKLFAAFGVIAHSDAGIVNVRANLRAAHLMVRDFFDPSFLMASVTLEKKESAVFIDFGASGTTVSVWTARGPVFMQKIPIGGEDVTAAIAGALGLTRAAAEIIKRKNLAAASNDMDRFTPADPKYDFSRHDVIDASARALSEIVKSAADSAKPAAEKYNAQNVYIFGGGANIPGIENMVSGAFGLPVKNVGIDSAAEALAKYLWRRVAKRANAYQASAARRENAMNKILGFIAKLIRKRKRKIFIPIMATTLPFNMKDPTVYALFRSGGISMIHVDIMDGLYVEKITGGLNELRFIRAHTNAHLSVHLMVENPLSWIGPTADAGADTIIVSTGTFGVVDSIKEIKALKKRAGIALHPNAKVSALAPILRDVDEVLVMSIIPGAGGQEFLPDALRRIAYLAATRKRYNLNFKISVDGGINPETAKQCWAAGADYLAVGSYLANAPDFPMAVQSLLP